MAARQPRQAPTRERSIPPRQVIATGVAKSQQPRSAEEIFQNFPPPRSVSTLCFVLGAFLMKRSTPMPSKPVVLVNVLKVESKKQEALIALLKKNIDTVGSTLDGWKTSRLNAAADGATVVIYSECETPTAFEAMRNDPRMKACFPKILKSASVDSIMGATVLSESP
ncbi:MAG: hypothetical protein ABIO49_01185 [Dokdonella sp.]